MTTRRGPTGRSPVERAKQASSKRDRTPQNKRPSTPRAPRETETGAARHGQQEISSAIHSHNKWFRAFRLAIHLAFAAPAQRHSTTFVRCPSLTRSKDEPQIHRHKQIHSLKHARTHLPRTVLLLAAAAPADVLNSFFSAQIPHSVPPGPQRHLHRLLSLIPLLLTGSF